MGMAEWVTAKLAVAVDTHRPLRGPLKRPALRLADALVDLSAAAHRRWR